MTKIGYSGSLVVRSLLDRNRFQTLRKSHLLGRTIQMATAPRQNQRLQKIEERVSYGIGKTSVQALLIVRSLYFTLVLILFLPSPRLLGQTPPAGLPPIQQQNDQTQKNNNAKIVVHKIKSQDQSGPTEIHVLSPTVPIANQDIRVLYLLPVEKLNEQKWGHALQEIIQHNLHNKLGLLCVYPTFSDRPWFADHPQNASLQQETYLLKCVIPFVERQYGIKSSKEKRLLIGFSKSGYGAWSLLLRHPDIFDKAAAWDAPLMMQQPNQYGMGPIYGNQKNFQKYQISELLKSTGKSLGQRGRLVHGGYANFQSHHQQINTLTKELDLPVHFEQGPLRAHHWNSGWLQTLLFQLAGPQPRKTE